MITQFAQSVGRLLCPLFIAVAAYGQAGSWGRMIEMGSRTRALQDQIDQAAARAAKESGESSGEPRAGGNDGLGRKRFVNSRFLFTYPSGLAIEEASLEQVRLQSERDQMAVGVKNGGFIGVERCPSVHARLVQAHLDEEDDAALWLPVGQTSSSARRIGPAVTTIWRKLDLPGFLLTTTTVCSGFSAISVYSFARGAESKKLNDGVVDSLQLQGGLLP